MPLLGTSTMPTVVLSAVRAAPDNSLLWTPSSSSLHDFNLQRQIDGGGWVDMDSPEADDVSASDTDAADSATYQYRIRSRRGGRFGEWSNTAQVIVGGAPAGLLTEGDLTYLGAFKLPTTAGSWDWNNTDGATAAIAYRKGPDDVGRLILTTHIYSGGRAYEVNIPALATTAPYNTATIETAWGDIYDGKKWDDVQGGAALNDNVKTFALFWDDVDDRLYWGYLRWYGTASTSPCFGYSTLDDDANTATGVGAWNLEGVGLQRACSAIMRMPSAFVAANCPGQPLCVGGGGVAFSTIAGASMGPTINATVAPDIGTHANRSTIPGATILMEYAGPVTAAHGPPLRATRTADYRGRVYGTAQAGSSTTQLVLDPLNYTGDAYPGEQVEFVSGAADGQTATITHVSGYTHSLSPALSVDPTGCIYEMPNRDAGVQVWDPVGDVGFETTFDISVNSLVWVTGTKFGIIRAMTHGTGYQYYGPGGNRCEGVKFVLAVIDPDQIAAASNLWDPVADSEFEVTLPEFNHPGPYGSHFVTVGITLDQENRRLFVFSPEHDSNGIYFEPYVFVFSLGGSN
jgi:hypothetical protein